LPPTVVVVGGGAAEAVAAAPAPESPAGAGCDVGDSSAAGDGSECNLRKDKTMFNVDFYTKFLMLEMVVCFV
jgi:hypothetical protein